MKKRVTAEAGLRANGNASKNISFKTKFQEFHSRCRIIESSVNILFCIFVLSITWEVIFWSKSSPVETHGKRSSLGRKVSIPKVVDENLRRHSELITHVGSSGTGLMNKYFYRFKNVRIVDGRLKFYYDSNTFEAPKEEHWVDIVSCNATSPKHPTMLVVKGDAQPIRWHYIPIDYISVNDNPDEEQRINCPNRISQTAYLLQVRFSYNIWHTWNEGIMGVFQTLRELGKLPLAVVGDDGLLAEVHDGTGSSEDHCPWVFNHTLGKSQRQPSCIKENIPSNTFCDPVVDTWCEVGSTFSVHRNRGAQSPLILTFTPESTKNVWSHLYDSISLNQKTWSEVMGSCFDDLITGKTSTLNFYQTVNSTEPEQSVLAKIPRIDNLKARVDAMAVFKQFIMSSQREWVKLQRSQASTEPWNGYADVGMEKLRKGVSVEALHNGALNAVNPTSVPGAVQLEIDELRKTHEKYEQSTAPILNEFESLYGHSVPDHLSKSKAESLLDEESLAFRSTYSDGERLLKQKNRGGTNQLQTSHRQLQSQIDGTFHRSNIALEKPRPVVTYMSRNFFSRGIVNEKDILAYILSRYDVTLRVTTFQEPLLQVMELLSHTDVLLGMHGAGWTNALFMKRGAVAMQMFPYGWRLPNNSTVRGYNYREIVYASEGKYFEWVNPVRENAYFRRIDFNKGKTVQYQMHPRSVDHLPQDSWPGNQWIYQNTFVNMTVFKKEIDMLMAAAGIMPNS